MIRKRNPIRGVIAALLLPRDEAGQPLWDAFDRSARFLVDAGVSGLGVNGATGEYSGSTREERREAVVRSRRIAGEELAVLSGAGAARWTETAQFARDAELAGADAALVPPPHFFKYEPEDLAEFYRRIAADTTLPVLIYNLPTFTNPLPPELAAELIRNVDGIAGVKDSSGDLELLSLLTAPAPNGAVRLVGNDAALAESLEKGLCDGVVSGVAGVLPELTLALWRSAADRAWGRFRGLVELQTELLWRLEAFPTPWGLEFVAEARGFAPANPALPLSEERVGQVESFRVWFREWWAAAEPELGRSGPVRD